MSTRQTRMAAFAMSPADLRGDHWDRLVLLMPALAFVWIVAASCWSARVVGLL